MSDFLQGILGSIIVLILSALGVKLLRRYQMRGGVLAGRWIQKIPAFKGQPEKEDLVICKHRKKSHNVSGDIVRKTPLSQVSKKWKFEGHIFENIFIATYWCLDEKQKSFGVWLLVHTEENTFEGFYTRLRPEEKTIDKIVDLKLNIPFKWEFENP